MVQLMSRDLSPTDYELLLSLDNTVQRPFCDAATLKRVLEVLPPGASTPSADCAICLDALDQELAQLKRCQHVFHADCIRQHLANAVTCPLDNLNVTEM